jgi:hypothetical protein
MVVTVHQKKNRSFFSDDDVDVDNGDLGRPACGGFRIIAFVELTLLERTK